MQKTILVALAASVLATSAAQAAGFDGVYVGADGAYTTLKSEHTSYIDEKNWESSGVNFGIQLGYGTMMSGNFYLGAEMGLRNSLTGTETKTSTNGGVTEKVTSKVTTTKMFSIQPGFIVSPKTLVYARLGKGNADTESTDAISAPTYNESRKSTGNVDFTIYGLGVDYLMSKNLSVKAEANKLSFDSANGTSFNVGVNYRF